SAWAAPLARARRRSRRSTRSSRGRALQGGWWRRRLRFSQAKDALDAAKTALLILGERATGPGDEPGPFKRLPARGALRKKPGQCRDGALFVERGQEGL